MAYRRGVSRPARVPFADEDIERLHQLFREARFFDLEDRYLAERPRDGLFIDLHYRFGDRQKHVLAEEEVAPDRLMRLTGRLRDLIRQILEDFPDRPPIVGVIAVEPVFGEQSLPRNLSLTLKNRTEREQILHFPDSQMFDLMVYAPCDPLDDGSNTDPREESLAPSSPPVRLIWNWAHDQDFIQIPSRLVLEPHGEHTFEVRWFCETNLGAPVEDGMYGVSGHVTGRHRIPVQYARVVVGPPPPPRLVLELSVDPVVGPPGTPRSLEFVVHNPGRTAITLHFPDTQHYDFHITDPRRLRPTPIWSWSFGKGFADVLTELTIPAGGEVVFHERWNGKTNEGSVVGEGVYHVTALVTVLPPIPSRIVRLEVAQ
jgi:hypothetical protein